MRALGAGGREEGRQARPQSEERQRAQGLTRAITAARRGDRDAAEELARRAMTVSLRAAQAVLADRDSAGDVAQDAAFEAMRTLKKLRDPERFDAWVHKIATREAYRHARKRRRQGRQETAVDVALPLADPSAPAGSPERIAHVRGLAQALATLPERERTALVLRYVQDLSEAEVAKALRCAPGTAASLLSRARTRLQRDPRLAALFPAEKSHGD